MERKSDAVRRLVAEGDYKKALRIAKGFRLGISTEDSSAMAVGYECMVYPEFYRQIGIDPKEKIEAAISIVSRIYGGRDV